MSKDTILAAGASGDQAQQLIALLQAAGFPVGTVSEITPDVMGVVAVAQAALGVVEPGSFSPAEPGLTIEGQLVGQATWDALRKAAAARTGLYLAAPADVGAQAAVVDEVKPAVEEAAPDASGAGAGTAGDGPSKEAQPAGGGWGT